MRQFPFSILGFHTDNGSEFINKTVAELLGKLLIEQTKSRPRQSGLPLRRTRSGASRPRAEGRAFPPFRDKAAEGWGTR